MLLDFVSIFSRLKLFNLIIKISIPVSRRGKNNLFLERFSSESLASLFWENLASLHQRVQFCVRFKFNVLTLSVDVNFNPLSAKLTKWPDTLKQFVGNLPTNSLSVFGHFVGLALKGLSLPKDIRLMPGQRLA